MNALKNKIALVIIAAALLMSACNGSPVKVVLPTNNCAAAACPAQTSPLHVYVNGQEITK